MGHDAASDVPAHALSNPANKAVVVPKKRNMGKKIRRDMMVKNNDYLPKSGYPQIGISYSCK